MPANMNTDCYFSFAVSIVVFALILILVVSEMQYYADTELKFDVEVDKNITGYDHTHYMSLLQCMKSNN